MVAGRADGRAGSGALRLSGGGVTFNGGPLPPPACRAVVGYVPQEDVLISSACCLDLKHQLAFFFICHLCFTRASRPPFQR